jgi:uncharacterized membrane protein
MIHLLHPAAVHFPVALLVLGALCETSGLLSARDGLRRFGGLLVIAGTLFLVPTIVTGYLAANSVAPNGAALRVVERHELVGWVAAGWFLACLFWKAWMRGEIAGDQRVPYALALLLGAALVIYGALLGGELVYSLGVGVGGR